MVFYRNFPSFPNDTISNLGHPPDPSAVKHPLCTLSPPFTLLHIWNLFFFPCFFFFKLQASVRSPPPKCFKGQKLWIVFAPCWSSDSLFFSKVPFNFTWSVNTLSILLFQKHWFTGLWQSPYSRIQPFPVVRKHFLCQGSCINDIKSKMTD